MSRWAEFSDEELLALHEGLSEYDGTWYSADEADEPTFTLIAELSDELRNRSVLSPHEMERRGIT
jgi:hypothetical protein